MKVVLFALVYVLCGCDFLPSDYNMPFKKKLALTMESICQDGLLDDALIERDEAGKWTLSREHGMKLMAVCYFMTHRKVFSVACTTAADVFRRCERNTTTFIQSVRETIWRAHRASGKTNVLAQMHLDTRCSDVVHSSVIGNRLLTRRWNFLRLGR